MSMIKLYGLHHLEHVIEHLPNGVMPKFELWFLDKNELKYGRKTFHNLAMIKEFINNDKFQKALKDGDFKKNMFFDSETNSVIWEAVE